MDEEVLNIQVRRFLKKVGIQSQREIEQAVKIIKKAHSRTKTGCYHVVMPEINL